MNETVTLNTWQDTPHKNLLYFILNPAGSVLMNSHLTPAMRAEKRQLDEASGVCGASGSL